MNIKVIAVSGGSGSGKTTFARKLHSELGEERSILFYQDSYYIDQSDRFDQDGGAVNFDHPDSLDFHLLKSHLQDLLNGESVNVPRYDFATHKRMVDTDAVEPHPVVIVDGTLLAAQTQMAQLWWRSIYIDCPESIRYERRLARDVSERGRTPEGVKTQFEAQVKPMHDLFVEPSKEHVDLVVTQETFEDALKDLVRDLL